MLIIVRQYLFWSKTSLLALISIEFMVLIRIFFQGKRLTIKEETNMIAISEYTYLYDTGSPLYYAGPPDAPYPPT